MPIWRWLSNFIQRRKADANKMGVAVVIPARNAAATIAETLDSLLTQTHQHWQAVVVDDGSTDATRTIAKSYAARDRRIRVKRGPKRGVSAARNAGIAATRFPWLYFLDADDTIEPETLQRLLEGIASDVSADAAHCGWIYTDPDGRFIGRNRCEERGPDLFPLLARYCALAIHSCLIRRSVVSRFGGFDETLRTSEDFDLWQRVARSGCRFVAVDADLSRYRLRPQASWFDAMSFAADALLVVRRGHAPDPRVPLGRSAPLYENGMPPSGLAGAELQLVGWAAGIAIARGEDPRPLLNLLGENRPIAVEGHQLADPIFRAIPFTLCRPVEEWVSLWDRMRGSAAAFFEAVEQRTGTRNLAERAMRALEQYVIAEFLKSEDTPRFSVGSIAVVRIETVQPIADLLLPGTHRLVCSVQCEGALLGTLFLPVCDGFMPASVIADAIAARYAWLLLQRLFERHIYPLLAAEAGARGWSIARGDLVLANGIGERPEGDELHEQIGWAIFLQELTGLLDWPIDQLHDPHIPSVDEIRSLVTSAFPAPVELSRPLPNFGNLSGNMLEIEAFIGGASLLRNRLPIHDGVVAASAIRAAVLHQGKMELARLAVREGVLGRSLDDSTPLRQRLRERADAVDSSVPASALLAGSAAPDQQERWAAMLHSVMGGAEGRVLAIGSAPSVSNSSEHRQCLLPAAASDLILQGLEEGQPALAIGEGPVSAVIHIPELRPAPQAPLDFQAQVSSGNAMTSRLPILMYHRIAPDGPEALARWRVTPEQFDAQLAHLRAAGFVPTTLMEWRLARAAAAPLPGQRVLITFDDGYVDFAEHAMPVLRRYGFGATVFLPTDLVGDCARWDAWNGDPAPLMDWDMIRTLHDEGIVFGSHSASHRRLIDLDAAEIVAEAERSRITLKRELGFWPDSIAYPFGAVDEVVARLLAACGYSHGLTTRHGKSGMDETDLSLSRVEVFGSDTLERFTATLGSE